jgi:hypothetical protein
VDRDAVDRPPFQTPLEPAQLAPAADGEHCPHVGPSAERLEQRPTSRTDCDARHGWHLAERLEHELREAVIATLEIEHQLCRRRERRQQVAEDETPRERIRQLPAIPEDRQRADRLQVPDFSATAKQSYVGLDECDAEGLRFVKAVEVVPGAMRDEELRVGR